MHNNMNKRGFTLIELMVVMAILAILLGIGAGAFTTSMKKGRDTTRKANIRAITNALELYYNDKRKYPGDDGSGGMKGCGTDAVPALCAVNGAFQDQNGTLYMQQLPTDPVSSQIYYYRSPSTSQFQIYARLENAQDPSIITPSGTVPSCGSGACNWGLSSANITP